ncbi:PIN domain-containing protein [Xanthobacter sp. VTT E-85237]
MSGIPDPQDEARIYLDTNVFIDVFEGQGPISRALEALFLAEGDWKLQPLVTSELTLSELLVKPLETRRAELVSVYDNWTITNDQIEVVPVVRRVLHTAAEIRAKEKSMKLPDAIHVASAVAVGCRFFLTRDTTLWTPPEISKVLTTEDNVWRLFKEISARAH